MKRLIISISVIFFLASFSLVPALAEEKGQTPNQLLQQVAEKILYRLKLKEGQQYYLQMINEQQVSDPTSAQKQTAVITIGTGAKFEVSDIDSDGNAQVTYTYKWVKFRLKMPKVEQVYDSSKKDSPVPPMAQGYAALLEESFSLKITPEGRVSEIKGLDKVRSNIQKKLPPGQMQGFIMNSLNQWINDEAVKELIESSMEIYPDKPVGVGDSWSRKVAISREYAMIYENKWTLKERKNGVAVIEVFSTIKPNPEAKPKEVGAAKMSYEFTGKQQGLIEMQESTGLIIHSKINQQMSGQSIMTSPGVPDKATPMEITGVVTMETSDWEKAKSIVGINAVATPDVVKTGDNAFGGPEWAERREQATRSLHQTESPLIGKPAPSFTLKDLTGKNVSLSDFNGKVVILDFWATWCPPCVKEIPHFIELYEQYKSQGLAMVGISVDHKGVGIVKSFVQKYQVNYPILMADSQIQKAYGNIPAIPTTFVIDSAGKIQRMYVGYRDKAVFEADIKTLLAGVKFAGIESEESGIPQTNYVAELNKIGIAGRSESDNAAPYYQKAIELFVKQPEGLEVSTRGWPKELPAQQQALLRKWVQDNSRALEQLQLGSRKPYYWLKQTGEKLQTIEMPHLSTRRQLAFALQARAKLQAEDRNITSATNDIFALYTFGAHVTAGPRSLVEKLVGIAVKSLSIRTAFNILDRNMTDGNLMKSLEDKFKQLVTDYSEPFDMRGEKIQIQEQIETDPKYRFFKPYLNSTLEYYDTIVTKNPWQLHNEKTQSIADDNPLIETAGSAMPRVIEIESRIRADEQALITTLALLRYNADSGGYPGALPQLASAGYIKELPIDPFSNKPLVYKQTRQGFTLYSFGADFDDDGGLRSKWGYGDEGGDQVFWPLEQPQMAERPSGRERSFARTEGPQRRATTFARSAAQPYQIDDEEGYVPAQPRRNEQKRAETLHEAARNGDVDQIQLLISKGADVNEKNRMGWTPLHTAVQNRKLEVIEPLIAKGADVNAKDSRGQTPLMAAVNTSQKDAVELLIVKGADVNLMGGSNNALSLAKKRRKTEIVDLLLKHGAKEPSPEDLIGDRYYGNQGGASPYPDYEDYGARGTTRRGTRTFGPIAQSPVQVDILADPNEIKARVKTFEGLEKALEVVDANSQNEIRQWQQKRYDNRTLLIRTVQKQFEDEIGVIRKVAVEEKAKKTTETIDSLLTGKQKRFKKVSKELLTQKRELRQTQPARGRGRARTSGRSTRGRTSQRGQPYGDDTTDPYGRGGGVTSGTSRYQSTRRPTEQLDVETENEIRQWLQADVGDKTNLAQAVHEQLQVEISSIRSVAVEEEAKKTTAAIDGVLLYRQTRFEALISKMATEQQALRQQTQDPRIRGRGRYPQDGQIQQQNQPRTRGRRR